MVIQPFKEYSKLSIIGLDLKSHARIAEDVLRPFPRLEIDSSTRTQARSIGERVGILVSPEIIYLYGLLRIDPKNIFGPKENGFPPASDQTLLYEAFVFHGDVGAVEKMRQGYSHIFQ